MWYAFFLACGSSTDNFAVGASLGISHRPLHATANVVISLLNGAGAFIAGACGHLLGEIAPALAVLFAALIFGYLAADELIAWKRGDGAESTLTMGRSGGVKDAMRIAVPMTLNNLAGGVAGGAAGIDPRTAGTLAVLASYCMMKMGHVVGEFLMPSLGRHVDTRVISGAIFCGLSLSQAFQLWGFERSVI
jgi:putative Mn2+ efflux pump MntP